MAILDSAVSLFVSRRFIVCDKGEYLRNALNIIERCAALIYWSRTEKLQSDSWPTSVVRDFVQLATEVN
jgi:hypothetical protein